MKKIKNEKVGEINVREKVERNERERERERERANDSDSHTMQRLNWNSLKMYTDYSSYILDFVSSSYVFLPFSLDITTCIFMFYETFL